MSNRIIPAMSYKKSFILLVIVTSLACLLLLQYFEPLTVRIERFGTFRNVGMKIASYYANGSNLPPSIDYLVKTGLLTEEDGRFIKRNRVSQVSPSFEIGTNHVILTMPLKRKGDYYFCTNGNIFLSNKITAEVFRAWF